MYSFPYYGIPTLSRSHLKSSPMVESQLLHHVEEQARRDVELTNAKRAKLELEESLREYQARYSSHIVGFQLSYTCAVLHASV